MWNLMTHTQYQGKHLKASQHKCDDSSPKWRMTLTMHLQWDCLAILNSSQDILPLFQETKVTKTEWAGTQVSQHYYGGRSTVHHFQMDRVEIRAMTTLTSSQSALLCLSSLKMLFITDHIMGQKRDFCNIMLKNQFYRLTRQSNFLSQDLLSSVYNKVYFCMLVWKRQTIKTMVRPL